MLEFLSPGGTGKSITDFGFYQKKKQGIYNEEGAKKNVCCLKRDVGVKSNWGRRRGSICWVVRSEQFSIQE